MDRLAILIDNMPDAETQLISNAHETIPNPHTETTQEKKNRKGQIGEQIVLSMLKNAGWTAMTHVIGGRPHDFDVLAFKNGVRRAIDIKTYPARSVYPDTGINHNHFVKYQEFSHSSDTEFWIYFVDEVAGKVYGNSLLELERPRTVRGIQYPMTQESKTGKKRYWPTQAMITLGSIPKQTQHQLKRLRQSRFK